jgi:hypothetical protein
MSESAMAKFPGNYEPWWIHEDVGDSAQSAAAVSNELTRIESLENYRRQCDRMFSRYYGDPRYAGFSLGAKYPSPDILDETSSSENVVREIISTLHNKFGKNKPVPTVVTTGGTYTEQEQSQEREAWIQGVFQQDKVYDKLATAQFHSMAICDGFIGVRDDYDVGRPVSYIIPPWEIHVDPVDAQYGHPRSLFRVCTESKEVLAARYPDYAEEIWKSTPFSQEYYGIRVANSDMRQTTYVEAWHLPSKPGADDGIHVIAVKGCTLVNEQWDEDYFPVVKLPWIPRVIGYFSVGLIEDLIPPQRQLNKVRAAKDEHLRLLSSSFWSVKRGANIVKSHLSNLIGRVIETTDEAPQLHVPQPISPDLWKSEEQLRNQIYAQSGVSQSSAQSMKPAGLNSGKALRVYADQEDQRFTNALKAKEDAVVELANLYCRRAQAMYESDLDPKLEVKLSKNSLVKTIAWKDIDLDSFHVQVMDASALSTTLAGKIEDVEDLESLGLITDVDQKRQLLQMPDLKADSDLSLAPRNLILKTLQNRILKDGESVTPEPYWDLNTCATLGVQVLCFAELKEYPPAKIQLLRNWVNECAARLAPPAPPQAPMGPPQAPMGPPQDLSGFDPGMPPPAGPIAGMPVPGGPIPGAP